MPPREPVLNTSSYPSSQLVVAEEPVAEYIDAPQAEAPTGLSVTQIVAIMSAHWRLSLIIFISVLALAAVVTKLMPKTYTAIATLMVSYEDNDPLASKAFPAGLPGGFFETQIALMKSSEVLDPVIERLQLGSDPEFAAGNRGGDATIRDWVEGKLRKNLDIEQGQGGSQLIYVTASANSAAKAADIANMVAVVYTEQLNERVSGPASERAKRYSEELADLKKKVEVAQDAVTKFRAHTGTIDLDAKVDLDMDTLTNLEHRLLDTRNALRSNEAHATGNQNVSANVLASSTVQKLREEEARLRSKMAQLRTEFGPNHPQVVELQSQIDANDASLSAALKTYSSAVSSDIVVGSNEVASLERAVEAQRQKVLEGRKFRDEGAKYELELESAQAVYKRALDGYDQIMFASTGHLANVNLASRARAPVKAEKPNAIKNMAIGAFLGLLLGIGGPFLFEMLNRRVRCRDDVERLFGIPVLTEFSPLLPPPAAAA
jgi:uncharacterized protein involved in exopolysaccharide biosynthesis